MCAIWTGVELLAVCSILLHRHIVAQEEEIDVVVRASEFDNATLTWPVPEKASGQRLDIINVSNKTIIYFISGFPLGYDSARVKPPIKNTTLGFTFLNASLSDAGEYRCRVQGIYCGRKMLFIWGQPKRARVIPEDGRLRCVVEVTSEPKEHRPPVANMMYRWYTRDMLPLKSAFHNNQPGNATLLLTGESYISLGHADNGSDYSCYGREEGSRLWSDSSEWLQYVFYGPGPSVPDERNNASSPNVTDTGKDKVLDIDPGSPEFVIIVSLVSLVAVLILAVIIAVVILCRRKKSTEVNQNATNNHQMAAKSHEQYSDEEDSTVLVDNTEYSDNNYFGSDSGLGEYSDIREIERLRIKDRGPAPLPQNENIYELQESVQVSDEHKAKLDNQDDEDEERIVTDIYAVPMKKGTLK